MFCFYSNNPNGNKTNELSNRKIKNEINILFSTFGDLKLTYDIAWFYIVLGRLSIDKTKNIDSKEINGLVSLLLIY